MSGQRWEVVGGVDKGGILVRTGQETTSTQLAERLATGSEVEELQLAGERLRYRRVSGTGPAEGWVSVRISGKDLLVRKAVSVTAVPAVTAARLPRVLCLHGTAGGRAIMELQCARLFAKARGLIDFFILEAPKECNNAETVAVMNQFFKGKPMMMYDEVMLDEHGWRIYKEVRDTLAWLQARMEEHGPFDGVLGFSQGANFSVMLAAQSFAGVGMPLRFVVPICPNTPGYTAQVPEVFEAPIRVPALVVRGAKETYEEGMQKALEGKVIDTRGEAIVSDHVVKLFDGAEVFTHPDGHRPLPAQPKDQEDMVQKVITFMLEKCNLPAVVR